MAQKKQQLVEVKQSSSACLVLFRKNVGTKKIYMKSSGVTVQLETARCVKEEQSEQATDGQVKLTARCTGSPAAPVR